MKKKILALLALMTCTSVTLATGCDALGGIGGGGSASSSSLENTLPNSDSSVDVGLSEEDASLGGEIDSNEDASASNEDSSNKGEVEAGENELVMEIGTLVTDSARQEEIFQALIAACENESKEIEENVSWTSVVKTYKMMDASDLYAPENWVEHRYESYNALTGEGYCQAISGFDIFGGITENSSREEYVSKVFQVNNTYYKYENAANTYFDGDNVVTDEYETYLQYSSLELAWGYDPTDGSMEIEYTPFAGLMYAQTFAEYCTANDTVFAELGQVPTIELYENGEYLTIKRIAGDSESYSEVYMTVKDNAVYAVSEVYGYTYGGEGYRQESAYYMACDQEGFDAIAVELPDDVPIYEEGESPEYPDGPVMTNIVTVHTEGVKFFETVWYEGQYEKDIEPEIENFYGTPKYFRGMFMMFESGLPSSLLDYYEVEWYVDAEYTQSLTAWVESKEGNEEFAVYAGWEDVTDVYGKLVLKDGVDIAHVRVSHSVTVASVEGAYKIVFGDTAHTHEPDEWIEWELLTSGEYVFECDLDEYTIYVNGEEVTSSSITLECGGVYEIHYVGTADSSWCDCYSIM